MRAGLQELAAAKAGDGGVLLANQGPIVVDAFPMVVEAVTVPANGVSMEPFEQIDLSGLHGKVVVALELTRSLEH